LMRQIRSHKKIPDLKPRSVYPWVRQRLKSTLEAGLLDARYRSVRRRAFDLERPFVLCLPAGVNSYLNSASQPYYADMGEVVEKIWMALPMGYSLVIKDHPKIEFPNVWRQKIYEAVQKHTDIFYVTDQFSTSDLIAASKAVVVDTSSVAMEALTSFKPVITFGRKNFYFSVENPPTWPVQDLESLSGIFKECLGGSIDRGRVYAFLKAALVNSVRIESDGEGLPAGSLAGYRQMAHMLLGKVQSSAELRDPGWDSVTEV